ncbi:MAG: hypothetical protein FDZ75_01140 [Actinobacteria bacterium]|nr:MAG: hypothetical protein FDZ75_01140 [Actinomycetota bacterium]
MVRGSRVFGLVVAAGALAVVTGCSAGAQESGLAGSDGSKGAALVERKCSMCHTLDRINAATYDAATWAATVQRMQANGLVITADESSQIIDFLANRKL